MKSGVLGQLKKQGQEAEGALFASAPLYPDGWGSLLSPGLLHTSCHKAREKSALHYQRSCLPQAYGQQTPSPDPEHHGKCLLLTPALAQPLLPLEHWTMGSGAPTKPLPIGCSQSCIVPSCSSLHWMKEGREALRGQKGLWWASKDEGSHPLA